MIVVIVINLLFGLSAGYIDNWGHIGGLLGGALVALGIMPQYEAPSVVRYGAQPLAGSKTPTTGNGSGSSSAPWSLSAA